MRKDYAWLLLIFLMLPPAGKAEPKPILVAVSPTVVPWVGYEAYGTPPAPEQVLLVGSGFDTNDTVTLTPANAATLSYCNGHPMTAPVIRLPGPGTARFGFTVPGGWLAWEDYNPTAQQPQTRLAPLGPLLFNVTVAKNGAALSFASNPMSLEFESPARVQLSPQNFSMMVGDQVSVAMAPGVRSATVSNIQGTNVVTSTVLYGSTANVRFMLEAYNKTGLPQVLDGAGPGSSLVPQQIIDILPGIFTVPSPPSPPSTVTILGIYPGMGELTVVQPNGARSNTPSFEVADYSVTSVSGATAVYPGASTLVAVGGNLDGVPKTVNMGTAGPLSIAAPGGSTLTVPASGAVPVLLNTQAPAQPTSRPVGGGFILGVTVPWPPTGPRSFTVGSIGIVMDPGSPNVVGGLYDNFSAQPPYYELDGSWSSNGAGVYVIFQRTPTIAHQIIPSNSKDGVFQFSFSFDNNGGITLGVPQKDSNGNILNKIPSDQWQTAGAPGQGIGFIYILDKLKRQSVMVQKNIIQQ